MERERTTTALRGSRDKEEVYIDFVSDNYRKPKAPFVPACYNHESLLEFMSLESHSHENANPTR